jgi:hypothetical protein
MGVSLVTADKVYGIGDVDLNEERIFHVQSPDCGYQVECLVSGTNR